MKKIGLTGGIGSGKTYISYIFHYDTIFIIVGFSFVYLPGNLEQLLHTSEKIILLTFSLNLVAFLLDKILSSDFCFTLPNT